MLVLNLIVRWTTASFLSEPHILICTIWPTSSNAADLRPAICACSWPCVISIFIEDEIYFLVETKINLLHGQDGAYEKKNLLERPCGKKTFGILKNCGLPCNNFFLLCVYNNIYCHKACLCHCFIVHMSPIPERPLDDPIAVSRCSHSW